MRLMNRMMRDTLHGKDVENNSSIESIPQIFRIAYR